jgi:hypothetical protein
MQINAPAARIGIHAVNPYAPGAKTGWRAVKPWIPTARAGWRQLVTAPAFAPGPPTAGTGWTAITQQPVVYGVVAFTPADMSALPTTRPTFSLVVSMPEADGQQLELQYDTDDLFTSPTTVTLAPAAVDAILPTLIPVDVDLASGDYYWRVRVNDGTTWRSWSPTREFTIDTTRAVATLDAVLTITDDPNTPTIWYLDPDAITPGHTITLTGIGLTDNPSTVQVNVAGDQVTPSSLATIPATADAYTADRTIDPVNQVVNVEHDTVVLTVPDTLTPPGGPVTLVRQL